MLEMREVIQFAMKAHRGQMYGNLPYIVHLSDVYKVLVEFDIDEQTILAGAWLHDVLEDTEYHYSDIKEMFGFEVAEIVFAVTDELGRNRRERKDKTWPKILKHPRAITLKQADMIANARQGIFEGSDILNMYKKEYPKFKSYFKGRGIDRLWEELDRLLLNEKS